MKSLPPKQPGLLPRCLFVLAMCILFTTAAQTQPLISRIKDIAKLDGIQDNVLMGYGLVAGLNGTGDGRRGFTAQTLTNLMQGLGVNVLQPDSITTEVIPDNVAAVMVTAYLPPFARPGSKVDVYVASVGRATSLQGGYLLTTPLKGADGKYHGVAQGGISIGGFQAGAGGGGGGAGSASVQENHPTVGVIANGMIIEGEPIQHEVIQDGNSLRWLLDNPDFKTASNMQRKINTVCGQKVAIAEDAAAVRVVLAMNPQGEILLGNQVFDSLVDAIAYIDETQIETDEPAKIIINERTGTIIGGEDIRVRNVVIAYGTLRITIQTTPEVTPGQPFSNAGNTTTNQANVQAQTGDKVAVIRGTTLGEVITNLNTLGFTPKDLINILQQMHAYGAIKADLIFQ